MPTKAPIRAKCLKNLFHLQLTIADEFKLYDCKIIKKNTLNQFCMSPDSYKYLLINILYVLTVRIRA